MVNTEQVMIDDALQQVEDPPPRENQAEMEGPTRSETASTPSLDWGLLHE